MIAILAAAVTFVLVGSLTYLFLGWLAALLLSQTFAMEAFLSVIDGDLQKAASIGLGIFIVKIVASLAAAISMATDVYDSLD